MELSLALMWRLHPRDLRRLRTAVITGRLPVPWCERDLDHALTGLPAGLAAELRTRPDPSAIDRAEAVMGRLGIVFLSCDDPRFPPLLRVIPDEPPYLFVRGDPFAGPDARRVAVVGSRAASQNGLELAYRMGRDLAMAGCVVVSGLARGIDGQAHRGALEAGGRSVAVLGTGCDLCYPPEHSGLFGRIIGSGGIVSEFPPGTPGFRLHFPRRNRILSGLCGAVVVVEGTERSGVRSTVDHALDQGREVLAVPRDPLGPGAALPNALIRDGARPALAVGDIMAALEESAGVTRCSGAEAEEPASLEQMLMAILRAGSACLDDCMAKMPEAGVGEVQAALVRLELQGRIRRLPGGRYGAA